MDMSIGIDVSGSKRLPEWAEEGSAISQGGISAPFTKQPGIGGRQVVAKMANSSHYPLLSRSIVACFLSPSYSIYPASCFLGILVTPNLSPRSWLHCLKLSQSRYVHRYIPVDGGDVAYLQCSFFSEITALTHEFVGTGFVHVNTMKITQRIVDDVGYPNHYVCTSITTLRRRAS